MNTSVMALSRERFVQPEVGQALVANNESYEIAGGIGNGAIGVVRKAVNTRTKEIYAIKFLAPELKYIEQGSLEDIYQRFRREGIRGSGLMHDNLVKVLAYEDNECGINFLGEGTRPQNPFIIMEYVPGRTLEDHIKKIKAAPSPGYNINRQTLSIAHRIAEALAYLHQHKIVHRDIKPANIFLSRSNLIDAIPSVVKLGDFGVVKWGDFRASISSGTLTVTGQAGLGTLKYMPPEQSLDPKNVNVKSDMYCLGITLFELFTNQILPSIHHVFQIQQIRTDRSTGVRTTSGKLNALGLGPVPVQLKNHEYLFELILDMFLRPSGRPDSRRIANILGGYVKRANQPNYDF